METRQRAAKGQQMGGVCHICGHWEYQQMVMRDLDDHHLGKLLLLLSRFTLDSTLATAPAPAALSRLPPPHRSDPMPPHPY